jgi:D-inositol-3-phosphate glycosyltransferase
MNVVEFALAQELARMGHRLDLVTRRSSPDQPDVQRLGEGIYLRHLDAGPPTPLPKSAIDDHIPQFSANLGALGPYELVHAHHWMSGVATLDWAGRWGVPMVQSYHSVAALPNSSLTDGEPPESARRVAGEALVARRADAIVAISAAESHTVIERCGADPDRVHIISPGVDHRLFHPAHHAKHHPSDEPLRDIASPGLGTDDTAQGDPAPSSQSERPCCPQHHPSPDNEPYLLFAARLQPLKGPDLAIRALAEVPQPLRPKLLIAGDVSADFLSYENELKVLTQRLGLEDRVDFIGPQHREHLAKLMRHAEIVLVPSYSETFGLVALEAAASGTPVIASSAGGLREAVAHLETGHLLDSRDPRDWGRTIALLLQDRHRHATMRIVSEVHARRFDWHWSGAKLEALYRQLIATHQL